MKHLVFLILIFLATNIYAEMIVCQYPPKTQTGESFRDFVWDEKEQKKIDRMTEKEKESYFLNKWFDQYEKEQT